MSALSPPQSPAIDPAVFLAEQLGFISLHANMAQQYIEIGDAPGLDYSLKSLTARVRAVVGLTNDLRAPRPEDQHDRG